MENSISPFEASVLADLATCASEAFLREVELLVGGGVWIEPAEFMLSDAAGSLQSLDSVTSDTGAVVVRNVALEVNAVCGEDGSCRDVSTGASEMLESEAENWARPAISEATSSTVFVFSGKYNEVEAPFVVGVCAVWGVKENKGLEPNPDGHGERGSWDLESCVGV